MLLVLRAKLPGFLAALCRKCLFTICENIKLGSCLISPCTSCCQHCRGFSFMFVHQHDHFFFFELTCATMPIASVHQVQQRLIGSWREPGGHVVQCAPTWAELFLTRLLQEIMHLVLRHNLSFGFYLLFFTSSVYFIPGCLICVRSPLSPSLSFSDS